ncbi:MAG: GreA/GreB family elongation factor [Dehalococcoidales bacterium]
MESGGLQNPGLGEAASLFLAKLAPEKREISQPEVYKFVRWYGWERPLAGLTAPEVANYAERLSLSDTDYAKKLELIRAFLTYAKKVGWSKTNLGIHLKARKAKAGVQPSVRQGLPETVALTQQGYAEIEAELADLKRKRPQLIEEMRRAAADKDFRENAPLVAAREQRGHLEGRIKELEKTLKAATIVNAAQKSGLKANIGDRIVLGDLTSGEELHYVLVGPREVDPAQGKISSISPLGKALIGRGEGEIVEVAVPAGKLRYQVKHIEH